MVKKREEVTGENNLEDWKHVEEGKVMVLSVQGRKSNQEMG